MDQPTRAGAFARWWHEWLNGTDLKFALWVKGEIEMIRRIQTHRKIRSRGRYRCNTETPRIIVVVISLTLLLQALVVMMFTVWRHHAPGVFLRWFILILIIVVPSELWSVFFPMFYFRISSCFFVFFVKFVVFFLIIFPFYVPHFQLPVPRSK